MQTKNNKGREKKTEERETWYFNFKLRNWILKISLDLYLSQLLWPLKVLLVDLKHYFSTTTLKKFTNLWHLWGSIYEAKLMIYRRSHPKVLCKKGFPRNLEKIHKKTLAP